jgi:hypothetical protein
MKTPSMKSSLVILSCLVFICCKKKEEQSTATSSTTEVVASEFQITEGGTPVAIVEKDNKVLLLMDNNGETNLVKLNSNGQQVWIKSYPALTGKPVNLLATEDGYVFTLVQRELVQSKGEVYFGYFLESAFKCTYGIKDYFLKNDTLPSLDQNHKTHVVKVDENGQQKWSTTIQNEQVGRLLTTSSGSLYAATVQNTFLTDNYTVDYRFGGDYPVITFSPFGSSMDLFQLDLLSGLVLNEHPINANTIVGLELQSESDYFELISTNNTLFIGHQQGFVQFNNGAFNAFNGPYQLCAEKGLKMHKIHSTALTAEEHLYLVGSYKDSSNTKQDYLAKVDRYGSQLWIRKGDYGVSPNLLPSTTNTDFYMVRQSGLVECINTQGDLKWSKRIIPELSSSRTITNVLTHTNEGVIVVLKEGEKYVLVRIAS